MAHRFAVIACVSGALLVVSRPGLAEPPQTRDVSVYEVSPWLDGAVIVGTNAVTLGLYEFGSSLIHPSCPCNPAQVNAFDRHTIGNHNDTAFGVATATVWASSVVPLVLDVWDLRALQPVLEDAIVLGEALSVTGAATTVTKYAIQRPFPRTFAGDPMLVGNSSGYRSFFSGHTAVTFSALGVASMTVGRRYDVHVLPWLITVAVGSVVGAGVVLGGWHFPTDVVVGALVGTGVGVAVPALHFTEMPVRPVVSAVPGGGAIIGVAGALR